jgi:hypothetical protein
MKAANARSQFLTAARFRTLGLGRHLAHCRSKERRVPAPAVPSPSPAAGRQNADKVRLRQPREAKARHALPRFLVRSNRQAAEICIELGISDLGEFAAVERSDAGIDLLS